METIEQAIEARASYAPRVKPTDIEAEVILEWYFTAQAGMHQADPGGSVEEKMPAAWEALGLLTFCVLVLRNGYTVTGESACASPDNFDARIGYRIARENAVKKVWPLLGFRLRDELSRPTLTEADALADLHGEPRPSQAV